MYVWHAYVHSMFKAIQKKNAVLFDYHHCYVFIRVFFAWLMSDDFWTYVFHCFPGKNNSRIGFPMV